jgi:Flp pilus assembly protein TadD
MGLFDKIKADRTASKHNEQGLKLTESGRLQEAIEQFNLGIKAAPEDGTLRYNLGLAHANAYEPEKTLAQFRQAIRFAPARSDA